MANLVEDAFNKDPQDSHEVLSQEITSNSWRSGSEAPGKRGLGAELQCSVIFTIFFYKNSAVLGIFIGSNS